MEGQLLAKCKEFVDLHLLLWSTCYVVVLLAYPIHILIGIFIIMKMFFVDHLLFIYDSARASLSNSYEIKKIKLHIPEVGEM